MVITGLDDDGDVDVVLRAGDVSLRGGVCDDGDGMDTDDFDDVTGDDVYLTDDS